MKDEQEEQIEVINADNVYALMTTKAEISIKLEQFSNASEALDLANQAHSSTTKQDHGYWFGKYLLVRGTIFEKESELKQAQKLYSQSHSIFT